MSAPPNNYSLIQIIIDDAMEAAAFEEDEEDEDNSDSSLSIDSFGQIRTLHPKRCGNASSCHSFTVISGLNAFVD